jgi:hypothetical protein
LLNQKLEEVHCSPKGEPQITFPPATPPSARFNVGLLGDSGVGKTAFLEAMAADREECEAVGLNAFTVPMQSDTVGLVHLIAYDFSGISYQIWMTPSLPPSPSDHSYFPPSSSTIFFNVLQVIARKFSETEGSITTVSFTEPSFFLIINLRLHVIL